VPVAVQKIEWGRFAAIADKAANISIVDKKAAGSELIAATGYYALLRSKGEAYVTPEKGSLGFVLKGGEAYIFSDNVTVKPVQAQLENGALTFNFDNKSYSTKFDLVNGAERILMTANGPVGSDGTFWTRTGYTPNTNMSLNGVLSNENGGSAAYVFQRTLDDNRFVNGVTTWGTK
jgi:hypothetical protein